QSLQQSLLEASARTAAGLQESVAAMETIRIFSAEEEEERRHGQNLATELRLKERMALELAFFTLVHRMLQLAIRVLVLLRSHQLLRDQRITPGALVTFLLYQDTVGSHVHVRPPPGNPPVRLSVLPSVHPSIPAPPTPLFPPPQVLLYGFNQ
ncbi:TAP2 protein, partial [Paradoxornis webbianus]|nr:TAP2 protein [Sinosuthora webbiana]